MGRLLREKRAGKGERYYKYLQVLEPDNYDR